MNNHIHMNGTPKSGIESNNSKKRGVNPKIMFSKEGSLSSIMVQGELQPKNKKKNTVDL